MTRKEFVTKATDSLAGQYSPGEAKAISVRILSHFLGLSEYEYSVEPGVIIPKPDLVRLQGALDELAADRPVQYVIGEESFAGHTFRVSESVLIPRPETEQLCRLVIDDWKRSGGHPEPRILDAGTGSGCIAWTLAAAFPKAEVFAFDIDRSALPGASRYFSTGHAGRESLTLPYFSRPTSSRDRRMPVTAATTRCPTSRKWTSWSPIPLTYAAARGTSWLRTS